MAGETLDVTSRVWHTDGATIHPEGETYTVADRWMAETLRAIGFVSIDGWTPPPDPPPPPAPPAGRDAAPSPPQTRPR
jgi:hypothetical protein